ncbi:MAG: TetR/AcrR family transcriptional regulator [Oscillospiraceae bacterium]|nr:TetR/AcrR family transcriptional regulator [Oscillospiraceae bacterium]
MPPKAKITKEMIVSAGLRIVRREGAENLNVRRAAAELNCSTQPVMYHFRAVSDLKAAVYDAADELHTEFIMTPDADAENPFLSVGLRYIQFAAEEKHLFRFLFQSDSFQNIGFQDLLRSEDISPVIASLRAAADITEAQAREIFEVLFICVHGAASLIANNSIRYEKAHFEKMLGSAFDNAVAALKGGA